MTSGSSAGWVLQHICYENISVWENEPKKWIGGTWSRQKHVIPIKKYIYIYPDKPAVSKNGQVTLSGERMQGLKRGGFWRWPQSTLKIMDCSDWGFLLQWSHYTKKNRDPERVKWVYYSPIVQNSFEIKTQMNLLPYLFPYFHFLSRGKGFTSSQALAQRLSSNASRAQAASRRHCPSQYQEGQPGFWYPTLVPTDLLTQELWWSYTLVCAFLIHWATVLAGPKGQRT